MQKDAENLKINADVLIGKHRSTQQCKKVQIKCGPEIQSHVSCNQRDIMTLKQ